MLWKVNEEPEISKLNEMMEVFRHMGVAKLSKENEEFLYTAIEELEIDRRLREEGIKEGIYTVARKLLMKGNDIEAVVDITELTREEVEALLKEI